MRKVWGITFGGLQQKIVNLVLIFILAIIAAFGAVSIYQSRNLTKVVSEAKTEQEQAISKTSKDTMQSVVNSSLTKTNALQAYIANSMFDSVKKDVTTLQTMASGIITNANSFGSQEVYPPDPANDGKPTAQVLCEEGVDYTKAEYLPIAAHMTDAMEAMYSSSAYSTNVYIGLEDGTCIIVDELSSNKFDENGNIPGFPVRERPWYTGAKEAGEIYFSGVSTDTYTGNICVTCSAPVYVNGEFVGVVGIDIFLDAMEDYVKKSTSQGGFICLVNDEGQLIFAPEDNGLFTIELSDNAKDLRRDENKELAEFVTSALSESTGLRTINASGKEYYMAGSPMTTVGWTVISVVEKSITEIPTGQMLDEYQKINQEASDKFEESAGHSQQTILVMVLVILALASSTALYLANRIVKPIESMTADIIEGANTGKLFEMKELYNTNDEIQVLAESFDDLSRKTKQYIIDITRITKEKERIGTELELARKIQANMLPNIYPAFPDRPEFDIYATMTPAKEVGGDFYDFFLIDEDHLGMVMADVSGKGVPAALFMMMSKILINNFAMHGGSPAKVLEQTNEVICQNNEEEMFVTVWFGILEISTGIITAANAGHEYPIIKKANGDFELFKDKHGFVVGGMEGMKYKEYTMQLEKGGALFLYTDGVPDATDSENVRFGTDRLLEAINRSKDTDTRTMLDNVKASVHEFVGEAEQFDDLTMLGLLLY